MLKLLFIPVALYLVVVGAIFFAQTSLLFPRSMVGPPPPLPRGGERLQLVLPSGERLHGVRIAPARPSDRAASPLIAFPGNAWNAGDAALYLHGLVPDREVVAFHYRGYAPSEGAPSAAALAEDALAVHDLVAGEPPRQPPIAVGFSIGSGVAAHLAAHRPTSGAILVTPFDSLAKVAAGHYRWLPVELLLRHRMDPAEDLRASDMPVAVIAAEGDTLIPPARAEALARVVPNLVFQTSIRGVGHNDIYQHPDFAAALREALERIEASAARTAAAPRA